MEALREASAFLDEIPRDELAGEKLPASDGGLDSGVTGALPGGWDV